VLPPVASLFVASKTNLESSCQAMGGSGGYAEDHFMVFKEPGLAGMDHFRPHYTKLSQSTGTS
jgi:hypothetical protein